MSNNPYCIYLDLDPYLAQWFVHDAGGTLPVELRKLSTERRILEVFLQKLPPGAKPDLKDDRKIEIAIPVSRTKPPKSYNYLPRRAKEELKRCIRNRFVIQLWNDLHYHGYIGCRRDNLIYTWMEAHGIELTETNWNTIAKIYIRQYKNYLQREQYKRKSKNNAE